MGSDPYVVVYSRWSFLTMGGSLKAGTTVYKIKYKFYEKYSLPKIQCKKNKITSICFGYLSCADTMKLKVNSILKTISSIKT